MLLSRSSLADVISKASVSLLIIPSSTTILSLRRLISSFKSCISNKVEGHYINIGYIPQHDMIFKNWEASSKQLIKNAIAQVNKDTIDVNFEVNDFCDFELDLDNDRSWDANFSFFCNLK